jgi:adenine-specific DNA-methyltransferase
MTSAHKPDKKPIETYEHKDKQRLNNPPVGLVTPETDREEGSRSYAHDPHLDPQLVWAGKAEHTSFLVPTVSLHVHERIDPRTIIAAVRRKSGLAAKQASLFEFSGENLPVREAIEFYKHRHGWSNRLVAGDSLLVMNSLLEKEGLAGQVQMIYMMLTDPFALPGTCVPGTRADPMSPPKNRISTSVSMIVPGRPRNPLSWTKIPK